MPESIINNLELIQINIQQRMCFFGVIARFLKRANQVILEFASVDQARQGIVRRLVTELTEQSRFLTDVMENHNRADDVANSVPNRCRGVLDRNFVATFRN